MSAFADRFYLVRQDLEVHAGQKRDRPKLIRPVQVQEEFELVGNGVRGRNNLVVVDRMALNAALSLGDFLIDGDQPTRACRLRKSREIP